MQLIKVDEKNLVEATEIARRIFPYEIHDGVFLPEYAYKLATEANDINYNYYLASENGRSIGITGYYLDDHDSQTAWLGWFGILPKYRGNGHGKKVLEMTIQKIQSLGFQSIRLYTAEREEEYIAQSLYEKNGFVKYDTEILNAETIFYYEKSL